MLCVETCVAVCDVEACYVWTHVLLCDFGVRCVWTHVLLCVMLEHVI